jgi:hypothetical protein
MLSRRFGFDAGPIYIKHFANKVAMGKVFSDFFGFPLSVSVHNYSVLNFTHITLNKQTENWIFEKAVLFKISKSVVLKNILM